MRFLLILACAIEARKLYQPALSSVKEFLSVLELLITALMTCLLESIVNRGTSGLDLEVMAMSCQ
jgi:hypothetical protein